MTTSLGQEDLTPDILVDAQKNHHPPKPPPLDNLYQILIRLFATNLVDFMEPTRLTLGNTVLNTSALTVIYMHQSIHPKPVNVDLENQNALLR